jgi:hypothetical protein
MNPCASELCRDVAWDLVCQILSLIRTTQDTHRLTVHFRYILHYLRAVVATDVVRHSVVDE